MTRTHSTAHRRCRHRLRRHCRSLNRAHIRSVPGFERRPDFLAQAIRAFRRAIRAHRRLARLSPALFDFAVVDRERQEREKRRRWRAIWEPVLSKVYGVATPSERQAELEADGLPKLHPRTERAMQRELANWSFWTATGGNALKRHCQCRPHALISLSQIARLLDVAFTFQRLACGLDASQPSQEPLWDDRSWESDLARVYG